MSLTLPRHTVRIHKQTVGLKGECPGVAVFRGEPDLVPLVPRGSRPGNHAIDKCAVVTLWFCFKRVSTHALTKILVGPRFYADAYENVRRLRWVQRQFQHLSGITLIDEGPNG